MYLQSCKIKGHFRMAARREGGRDGAVVPAQCLVRMLLEVSQELVTWMDMCQSP